MLKVTSVFGAHQVDAYGNAHVALGSVQQLDVKRRMHYVTIAMQERGPIPLRLSIDLQMDGPCSGHWRSLPFI